MCHIQPERRGWVNRIIIHFIIIDVYFSLFFSNFFLSWPRERFSQDEKSNISWQKCRVDFSWIIRTGIPAVPVLLSAPIQNSTSFCVSLSLSLSLYIYIYIYIHAHTYAPLCIFNDDRSFSQKTPTQIYKPSLLWLYNTQTALLQRVKNLLLQRVSWKWHKTIWWYGLGPGNLRIIEYSFITIASRSTLTWSSSTW